MKTARELAVLMGLLLFALGAAGIAYVWADGYIDRLPNHQGYFLVPVDNQVGVAPTQKPARTVFIMVDGLGHDSAKGMGVAQELARRGQCRRTYTGELTISRPVYTILSSGLEADRTGSRNNDETTPIAVESIWQVARDAGLRVHAASDVTWWRELFPGAFELYLHEPDTNVNLFAKIALGDITLVHPSRVDTAGHKHGAASANYAAAVALVDQEIEAFLATLDLERDLIVLTADHGHSDSGGHGGPDKRLSEVLTCFAGPGVRKAEGEGALIDARVIAPVLSVLLGLPFPKHMRAVEDPLDQIWSIVDEQALGTAYAGERKEHIAKFRSANASALGNWLGEPSGTWTALYQREGRKHTRGWLIFALLAAVFMSVGFRARRLHLKRSLGALLWMAGVLAAVAALYALVRGSLDFTSINARQEFLHASLSVCFSITALGLVAHALIWRNLRALCLDQFTLLAFVLALGLAHRLIYGVPLGFPLPGAFMIFLPFLHGALAIALGVWAAILCLVGRIQLFNFFV